MYVSEDYTITNCNCNCNNNYNYNYNCTWTQLSLIANDRENYAKSN